MLIIRENEVRELLKMDHCIDLLRNLFKEQFTSNSQLMTRQRLPLPSGSLQVMGGVVASSHAAGLKVYMSIPGNPSPQMVIMLFSTESGEPIALISANALGQIRTGAATGLATDYMARPDAETVCAIGSGFQAFSQLEAVCSVRHINKAFVYSRNLENRLKFAKLMTEYLGIEVCAQGTADQAVSSSEIICTITNSANPVFNGTAINLGAHINAAGSNSFARREVDKTTVQRSKVIVVDDIEQAKIEAGDLIGLENDNVFAWEDILSLGAVVSNQAIGRHSKQDITLFESQGIGTEDVITAMHVYQMALQRKLGEKVKL